jgi:POT family proton-dependent oligopeptide transporter
LLAWWRKREAAGLNPLPTQRMATGALIVGAAYLLLAALSSTAGEAGAHWMWFALFWVVLTLGELFILPTGLGLFRPACSRALRRDDGCFVVPGDVCRQPVGRLVGTLWTRLSHPVFFSLLASICLLAASGFAVRHAARQIRSD